MELSYILNQLGEDHAQYFNAVAPPIVQTSNFLFETVDDLRTAFANEFEANLYSRGHNPTVDILRKKLAALDGAEDALVFNSGASAIFCAVLPFVKAGAHIVSVRQPYTWAQRMFDVILPRFGVTTTYIDGNDPSEWETAAQPNTTVFYLESPNSWSYSLQDLAAVAAIARQRGIVSIIDNSYCTPLYQQPLAYGIDLSLQSATKYLGGHSDCVAGVLTGSKAHIERIFQSEFMNTGSGATPFHAWLLLRGLRTLPMRLQRISATTKAVVAYLKGRPEVEGLLFCGDPDFPQYDLAQRQMKDSFGLLTWSLRAARVEQIEAFCESLQSFKMAVSWGGHESLIIPRCAGLPREKFDAANARHRWLRMYIGLEDAEYLIADLEQAFLQLHST